MASLFFVDRSPHAIERRSLFAANKSMPKDAAGFRHEPKLAAGEEIGLLATVSKGCGGKNRQPPQPGTLVKAFLAWVRTGWPPAS